MQLEFELGELDQSKACPEPKIRTAYMTACCSDGISVMNMRPG